MSPKIMLLETSPYPAPPRSRTSRYEGPRGRGSRGSGDGEGITYPGTRHISPPHLHSPLPSSRGVRHHFSPIIGPPCLMGVSANTAGSKHRAGRDSLCCNWVTAESLMEQACYPGWRTGQSEGFLKRSGDKRLIGTRGLTGREARVETCRLPN